MQGDKTFCLTIYRQNRCAAHEADECLSINQLHRAARQITRVFAADGVLNKLRKAVFAARANWAMRISYSTARAKTIAVVTQGARGAARELSRKGWGRTSGAIIIALLSLAGMKQSQRATKLRRPLRRRD
jgi:hypothetical protein